MPPAARSSAGATLAVVLLLLSACSGGGSSGSASSGHAGPSRAQYVAQATHICQAYQRRIGSLKGSTDLTQLAAQGAHAVALEAAELKQLRALTPPAADRTAITQMLAGLQAAIDTGGKLVSDARSGDAAAVSADASSLQSQLVATTRLAKPFGLDVCAR
jgi:hypothetical protein